MSKKSIKLKNDHYIDSSGIMHNREPLNNIIIIDKFNDTSGNGWKEMLKNKINYCIPLFTRTNQTISLNGGWQGVDFGFAMVSRINNVYQIVWCSNSGIYYCRKIGDEYNYWSTSDGITNAGNGWKKKEYPDRTEYFKTMNFTYTYDEAGWGWVSFNNENSLPTGITFNANTMIFSGNARCDDTAISLNVGVSNGSKVIDINWRNKYWDKVINVNSWCNFHLTVYK